MVSPHKRILDIVSDFCALQRPSTSRKMQLQELVLPYIDILDDADLKSICSQLSKSAHAPKLLVLALCTQPVDICHALLIASPVLGHGDYVKIIDGTSIEHARIIARNLTIEPETSALLRSICDPRIDRSLDLRQRPRFFADIEQINSEDVQSANTKEDTVVSTFENLHAEHSNDVIYTAISDKMGLSISSVKIICADFTSSNLPTTMHFLGLSVDNAWKLYKRLAGSFAETRDLETAFRNRYSRLNRDVTRSVISAWQIEELATMARYGDVANQPEATASPKSKSA